LPIGITAQLKFKGRCTKAQKLLAIYLGELHRKKNKAECREIIGRPKYMNMTISRIASYKRILKIAENPTYYSKSHKILQTSDHNSQGLDPWSQEKKNITRSQVNMGY
jgi:hypothetical protein